MMDHRVSMDGGPARPVSELSTSEILEVLRDGVEITDDDGGGQFTADDCMERLRIELVIRQLEGRS